MKRMRNQRRLGVAIGLFIVCSLSGVGCATASVSDEVDQPTGQTGLLTLPALALAELNGERLHVVATTSIVGDVVAQVGGTAVDLTVLMGPGQDPHSFQPGAQTLTAVANAQVIFVNGWDLEEALVHDLETIGANAPLVPVSAGIVPLIFGADAHDEEEGNEHSGADPHTWQSVANVRQWVANIQQTLSALDPANGAVYAENAAAYLAELDALEAYVTEQLASIPAENRVLITNHGTLAYFAQAYNFGILDTVLPGMSTLAEASASDIASLVAAMAEHGVCTIFTENTSSAALAEAVAADLQGCEEVQVLPLYTDALGPAGSQADSYIGMFRANVDTIVAGLKP